MNYRRQNRRKHLAERQKRRPAAERSTTAWLAAIGAIAIVIVTALIGFDSKQAREREFSSLSPPSLAIKRLDIANEGHGGFELHFRIENSGDSEANFVCLTLIAIPPSWHASSCSEALGLNGINIPKGQQKSIPMTAPILEGILPTIGFTPTTAILFFAQNPSIPDAVEGDFCWSNPFFVGISSRDVYDNRHDAPYAVIFGQPREDGLHCGSSESNPP